MGRFVRRKPVAKALSTDNVWQVPARFNFTRDVVEALAADPSRPALTFVDGEGIIDRQTFKQVAADANRWAALLRSRGLVPGDRLLVFVGRTPAWHSILLGALKAGLVAVPCPAVLRAADMAFRAEHSGARLVVADRERASKLAQVTVPLEAVLVEEVAGELREHAVDQPTHDTAADDTAFILYTSGTAKDPRGAVHTHGYTWAQRLQAEHWLDAHPGDLVWCTAGTGVAKSIWNVLLGPWSCGAEIAIHGGEFEVEQRFALIERIGVTVLCQSAAEYGLMAEHPSLETFYLGSVRHAVSSGEPLNPGVVATFHDAFGLTIFDGYGQTENTVIVANRPDSAIRPGSIGLPTLGHEVAVIDGQGNEQPVGKEGDIALKGRPASLFREYWKAPDETRAAFRGEWYITGDRATRDADGYLWFTGRAEDVILSAAHSINPFEVESLLVEHPAVAECAVVGRPVAGRGQLVKAFVVLRVGVDGSDELVVELQDHVKAVTASYKVPREIEFVMELPRTASGKIRRVELRAAELREAEILALEQPGRARAETAKGAEEESRSAEAVLAEETEARRAAAADAALEEARRKKKARAAEAAAAAAVEAAARAERRADLERRTADALAEQTRREEEARQVQAVEHARLAAEQARVVKEQSLRENEERDAEATARTAPKAEPDPESRQHTTAPKEAGTEPSVRAARRETERRRKDEEQRSKEKEKAAAEQRKHDEAEERRSREAERQRKDDEKRRREEEKAAAEQARRDEADARRAAAAKAKEDERQRKEDEKRRREEEKAAAEQARRDEADARRAAAAKAKDDERQRKEEEKRRREEEKAAAEQARRDEADARRAAAAKAKEDRDAAAAEQRVANEKARQEAKTRSSAPPTIPEEDSEDDESRPNPALLARLREYGHGKDTEGSDTPAE